MTSRYGRTWPALCRAVAGVGISCCQRPMASKPTVDLAVQPDQREPDVQYYQAEVATAWERELMRSRISASQNRGQIHRCSRFCICQSTQKPQGSTRTSRYEVSNSIKSTYFHSVSTVFHKRSDLF